MNKLDVLNREEFVDNLINLSECISARKTSTTFAINGVWGCGKSFVLDMFENRLSNYQSEITAKDKYFIIRYNCWKYDYYEEPLVAIISAIVDCIESKTNLIPDSKGKRVAIEVLKSISTSLLKIRGSSIKTLIGFDIAETFESISKLAHKGIDEYRHEYSYDQYFSFKQVMCELSDQLSKLSNEYTLVILVDELDRCLPEYAIKVLERLHHLSEGSSNTITIISMDKTQLASSINKIFGFTDTDKYLRKFINFEISLDLGVVSDAISDKYKDYFDCFDKDILPFADPGEDFLQKLFAEIDIRTQEQLVSRAMIAHSLLFTTKKDYSFMYMELILTVLICVYGRKINFKGTPLNETDIGKMFGRNQDGLPYIFAQHIQTHFKLRDLTGKAESKHKAAWEQKERRAFRAVRPHPLQHLRKKLQPSKFAGTSELDLHNL